MAILKLTAASIHGVKKPYKWAHTITTTTTTSTTTTTTTPTVTTKPTTVPFKTTPSLSLSLNSNNWCRLIPCAYLSYNRKSHSFTTNLLGFPFINSKKRFSFFSSPSNSSSFTKLSGSGSDSSGSGLVDNMGSENKIHDANWYQNNNNNNINDLNINRSFKDEKNKKNNDDFNSKLLTLPTILTLGRVAAVPLLISTFYLDSWWGRTATTSIFIAAAVTDWLDGYLARKMRLGSAFGAFLDPVADKLMVAATLVLLCTKPLASAIFGQMPWLLTIPAIAIIGREITMSAVREWAASQNAKLLEAVAVNNLGKWKTATQMTALTILLATRDSSLGGPEVLVASGVALLYISSGLSLWSLGVYMSKIWKVLLK